MGKSTPRHYLLDTMVANAVTWTIHDLDAIPDDGGWKRYEIVDGELFVTCPPHIYHQGAAGSLNVCLEIWSEETGSGNSVQMPGIVFTDIDAVIPDVVWANKARLEVGINEAGHFTVAPELIVEVLSPGEKHEQRDKQIKLKLYSLHGVQEYWIVNWQLKAIEVYRRSDAMLQKAETLLVSDTLTSPLLPGFECPLGSVFMT